MTLSKGQGHRSRSNGLGSAERFLFLCRIRIAVYVPYNRVVADWMLKIKTKLGNKVDDVVYRHKPEIIILFNPFCPGEIIIIVYI